MELEYLSIQKRQSYESGTGDYKGQLKIKGQYGVIEIQLDSQLSADVLKLCAESLTRATKDLAQNMTAAVFESAAGNLIENKDG